MTRRCAEDDVGAVMEIRCSVVGEADDADGVGVSIRAATRRGAVVDAVGAVIVVGC